MPRTTLSQVAAALGISTMTVSRAMRSQAGVSAKLRTRILATAEKLGYRPDPELGRLMQHLRQGGVSGAKPTLCGLTNYPKDREPGYYTRLQRHAAKRARELGFEFFVHRVSPETGGWSAALRMLRARGVTGILLLPMSELVTCEEQDWSEFSVVSATSSVTAPRFHEVVPHHAENARLLIAQSLAQGAQRIGFIGLTTHTRRTREAIPSALAWHHAQNRLRCAPLLYQPGERPKLVAWAKRERPELVLMGSPSELPRFREELDRAGLKLPWALAYGRPFFEEAPGLDEREDLIGIAAVNSLSSLLQRGERGVPAVPTFISICGCWSEPRTPRER